MKLHKKTNHSLSSIYSWGQREEVALRVNFADFAPGDETPVDKVHYHTTKTMYFCVVSGTLIVEVEGEEITVTPEAMLEILPLEKYRVLGIGEEGCKYVVIGSNNQEDKVTL